MNGGTVAQWEVLKQLQGPWFNQHVLLGIVFFFFHVSP